MEVDLTYNYLRHTYVSYELKEKITFLFSQKINYVVNLILKKLIKYIVKS